MRKAMEQMPSIKSFMTPFPYQVDAGAALTEAEAMMRRHDIRHLPVTESGTLVGVLNWHALRRALAANAPRGTTVREAEVAQAACFELTDPLDRVLAAMADDHFECILVIKHDKLVGIFTVTDACRGFAEFLHSIFPPKDDGNAA